MRWEYHNYNFMQPENGNQLTFFANFNWGKSEVDYSISTAKMDYWTYMF